MPGRPKPWDDFYKANYPAGSQSDQELRERGGLLMKSSLYTACALPMNRDDGMDGIVHLSIKRNDRKPIRDWRHMQTMKNILVGKEREGVEIYPAESSLVDESNQYHMWILPLSWHLPFGFAIRSVGSVERAASSGARQRDWAVPPDDLDQFNGVMMDARKGEIVCDPDGQWKLMDDDAG